jgi:hypothetical protein
MTKDMIALCDKARKQGWKVRPGPNETIFFEPPIGGRLIVWGDCAAGIGHLIDMLEKLGYQP